jgi:hypothetical protein
VENPNARVVLDLDGTRSIHSIPVLYQFLRIASHESNPLARHPLQANFNQSNPSAYAVVAFVPLASRRHLASANVDEGISCARTRELKQDELSDVAPRMFLRSGTM